ncbi:MAG: hypothetical protein AB7F75_00760 [Planctomycetota bacterium]
MNAIITFLVALLRALIPALVAASKDTSEEGARAPEVRDRLRQRVRETWGKAARVGVLAFCLISLSGCFTRTIYVPDGTPVRLRETIRKAKVWVLDKDGNPVAGEMDLPEGWYCLPDPGKADEGGEK